MKTFVKGLIAVAVMFIGLFAFKPYSAYAASQYNDYQEQFNVSPSKVWKISFNNPVNLYTAQNNIFVYDSDNNTVPVTISVDSSNSKVVAVKPIYDYLLGKKYSMIIKSNCTSSNNKQLSSDVRMFFDIKTKLDPSDYDNGGTNTVAGLTGIVIVGTDRAYSVSYLLQNKDLANDINGNPSKKVYYIPDPLGLNTQNVKNMFGDNFTTYASMNALRINTSNLSDNIVYTDPTGNNYAYVWNVALQTYELKTWGVNVSVQLPSTTGAVSLTLNSVNAIPGAAYYQIDGTNIKRAVGQGVTNYVTLDSKVKIDILSSNQTILAYSYVDVSKAISNTVFPATLQTNDDPNIKGNSNNNGSAVYGEDGNTYYLNSGDNNTIYKTDDAGDLNQQIGLDKAQYMNEQSGWIYYSNYSDNQKIYRIKTDGSRREKVCDDSAAYLVVDKDWIYYSNHSQQGKLYKIGVSAGASTKDDIQPDPSTYIIDAAGIHGLPVNSINSSQIVPYDEVAFINVSNNWIYYVNNSDDHKIYKIDLDGNFRTKVNDEWSACPQVVGNEIYYCSKTGEIMKIGTDGNSNPVDLGQQTDDSNSNKTFSINVNGDWIYYCNKNDNKTLYKVKNDGSGENIKLTSFPIYYVMTAGEKLYIVSTSNLEYTLPIDSTGEDTPIPVSKTSPDNQIVKANDIKKVVDYMDVNKTIEWLEDKYLPDKVSVVMQDNKQQELTVSWDTQNKTYSNGVYTYIGTLVGYGRTVKLQLIIPSQMLNVTNAIQLINNPGANDYIKLSPNLASTPNETEVRAKTGDIIRVYADPTMTIQLNKGVAVAKDGTAMVSVGDLYGYGNAIYVTIQRSGKYESNPTKILEMDPPSISKAYNPQAGNDINPADFDAKDNDNVYLGATGADFTIYGWGEAKWEDTISNTPGISDVSEPSNGYDYMYVLPSTSSLDIRSAVPVKVGNNQQIPLVSGSHVSPITLSNDITVDSSSAKNKLVGGYYSIYIVRHYNLNDSSHNSDVFVTADPNGSRPVVTADIATEGPATEEVTAEGRPDQPVIIGPNKVNHEITKNVLATHGDKIELKKPLGSNEELWLVPTNSSLIPTIAGWAAQQHVSDANDNYKTMDALYASINGAQEKILTVKGSVQQNDFSVDNLDPSKTTTIESLSHGVSYYAFVMNDVQSSIQSTEYITADYEPPAVSLINPPVNSSYSYYYYDADTPSNLSTYLINIGYDDSTAGYLGTPGNIYIVKGNSMINPSLTDLQMNSFMIKPTGKNAVTQIVASQFAPGFYEIYAVDDAGNISYSNTADKKPITIYVNNTKYDSGGVINH